MNTFCEINTASPRRPMCGFFFSFISHRVRMKGFENVNFPTKSPAWNRRTHCQTISWRCYGAVDFLKPFIEHFAWDEVALCRWGGSHKKNTKSPAMMRIRPPSGEIYFTFPGNEDCSIGKEVTWDLYEKTSFKNTRCSGLEWKCVLTLKHLCSKTRCPKMKGK